MTSWRVSRWPPALRFVVMVGLMSFFADFTYEGSRSIIGQYLRTGSTATGGLFGVSLGVGVAFALAAELAAIPLILWVRRLLTP